MPDETRESNPLPARRSRVLMFLLAAGLFIGGLVVLLFLKRLPLPARLGVGLLDIIAGLAMLVALRQAGKR